MSKKEKSPKEIADSIRKLEREFIELGTSPIRTVSVPTPIKYGMYSIKKVVVKK